MTLITLYLLACISLNDAEITERQSLSDDCPIAIVQQEPEEKATAIFWVDKKNRKGKEPPRVRTVKAKVIIFNDGRIKFLSFNKYQKPEVEKYILEHLKEFTVTKKMLDGGYITPGEQYVQLRYMPEFVK